LITPLYFEGKKRRGKRKNGFCFPARLIGKAAAGAVGWDGYVLGDETLLTEKKSTSAKVSWKRADGCD
jgi:hypothetical protein